MYNVEFVDVANNRKFSFDNVKHIEVFGEFVRLSGFDFIFEDRSNYVITVHSNEYTYFKIEKETEKND